MLPQFEGYTAIFFGYTEVDRLPMLCQVVWIACRPDLPAGQVEILCNLVRQEHQARDEPLILLAPKPELEAPNDVMTPTPAR